MTSASQVRTGRESGGKLERQLLACCNFSFHCLAGMLHDSYLLGKIHTSTHSVSKRYIIYYTSNPERNIIYYLSALHPCTSESAVSCCAGRHRVAGCFQALLHLSLCMETQKPCAELRSSKRKRMPTMGSMQRQAG